jgi:hypothetical protein
MSLASYGWDDLGDQKTGRAEYDADQPKELGAAMIAA